MISVLGAGPHGRQIAALHSHYPVMLFDDDHPSHDPIERAVGSYLIGAAWPKVRRQIAAKAPTHLAPYRRGVVVFPGAQHAGDSLIGDHSHVGWNAVISHGCKVGSFVNICPGVVLAGEVTVEDDVFIGANATVIHGGITIHQQAVIGAGAVVLKDVPPGATVAGNPARIIKIAQALW
jgi:acetyltransferase-like isoleucine patch superfamily enzyme